MDFFGGKLLFVSFPEICFSLNFFVFVLKRQQLLHNRPKRKFSNSRCVVDKMFDCLCVIFYGFVTLTILHFLEKCLKFINWKAYLNCQSKSDSSRISRSLSSASLSWHACASCCYFEARIYNNKCQQRTHAVS